MQAPPFALPLVFAALLLPGAPASGAAQQAASSPNARHPGSAVVTVDDSEFLIRIECRVPGRPEDGFITEANRITRQETGGRYNAVTLRLRPWQETEDVVVSLQGLVAWLPKPGSVGGALTMELEMRPNVLHRDGQPVLVTYDMWKNGDVPEDRTTVRFEANCSTRDPAAPAFRKLPGR